MMKDCIINRDALLALRELPDESVHCCVTSPPYYALRDYGLDAQIGQEETPEQYIEKLVCALPGFVDSKNEEKTERNAGYLVVSHSGGGMLRQGTRKGIRRTPANRGMRAHRIVKSLDISEDVCHGLCP